jgi:hypothetical protein
LATTATVKSASKGTYVERLEAKKSKKLLSKRKLGKRRSILQKEMEKQEELLASQKLNETRSSGGEDNEDIMNKTKEAIQIVQEKLRQLNEVHFSVESDTDGMPPLEPLI